LSVTNRRQQQTFTHDVIRRLVEIEAELETLKHFGFLGRLRLGEAAHGRALSPPTGVVGPPADGVRGKGRNYRCGAFLPYRD
jgi:hypothetical protein